MAKTTIIAAVGQLPRDEAVLSRALEVSNAHGAGLHVVHVLDLPGSEADLCDISTFLGQAAFAARDRINTVLDGLGAESAMVDIHIELGAHALRLIETCRELAPDLVVMRAHQRKKLSEKFLGSTTERVIAAAATPVLVVKSPVEDRYRMAALATNGADHALKNLQFVSGLLPKVRLQLVQVAHIPRQLKEAMLRTGAGKTAFTDHREQLILAAEKHLQELAAKSGQDAVPLVLKGDPAKTLANFCHIQGMDLIALGQGRANIVKRAFIGSVSRRLLRDVACDVLIC